MTVCVCVCERVCVGMVRLHSCMNVESDAHGAHQCLLHSRRYSTCTARSRPASPNRTHSSGSVASSGCSCHSTSSKRQPLWSVSLVF